MRRPRKFKWLRVQGWQHVWSASEARFASSCNGPCYCSFQIEKQFHEITLFKIRLCKSRRGADNPTGQKMNMQNLAGQQALINSRLKDIIDEIDTNQSLMLRLRSHADSMALVLKSITSADQFLNYFSYVNAVLCKYMNVISDNNCKLQTVLNEELLKRNFTYNEYEDFVNCRLEPVPANTLDAPNEFYNLQLTNNSSEQSNIQDFGYFTGVTNVQSSENLEYAFGGNYDFVNIALENSEKDLVTERYMQYLSNDFFTYQDLGYPTIPNINENREVSAQDIRIPEFTGYQGDEVLTQSTNPFLFYGQSDEVTVQPAQSSQLTLNDVEGIEEKLYFEVGKGERQFYVEENEGQYYEEVKKEQKGGERCNNEVKGEQSHEEEQSSEESDEQAVESGNRSGNSDSVNEFDIKALTNNASSQEICGSLANEAEEDNGKKSVQTTREYSAEVTHAVSPSEIYVRLIQESCPLLQKLLDEMEALKTDEKYKRPHFPPRQKSKKGNKSRLKKLGKYALYYSEADKTFFRAQFLDEGLDTADNMVSVRLVDTGIEDRVSLINIYPMSEKLEKFPRFAVKCHLTHISPDDSANSYNWSLDDIEFMKEWISKNDRVLIVVDEDARKDGKSLPILLYDLEKARCLNDEMREIRESKCKENQKLYKFILDNWDPMLDAHESNFNTYDLDHDDPSCAVYGYVAKDYERICKIYRKTGRCFKGEGCRKEHRPLNSSGYTTDQEEIFIDAYNSLQIPAVGDKLKVEITHIVTGTRFHCNAFRQAAADEEETLRSLVDYMNEKENVLKLKRISIPPSVGQIVVARFTGDSYWYRAKVLVAIPENDEYIVIFVDYGNEETVSLSGLRHILPQFLHLPFQCMLCDIDGVISAPDSKKESVEYLYEFASKVVEIEIVSILPGFMPHMIVRLYTNEGEDAREIMMQKNLVLPRKRLVLKNYDIIPG